MRINTAPVKDKLANTPMILQIEMLECGAACLDMILAYYGKWLPLDQVRRDCGVSRDGSNAKKIALAAKSYGLKVAGKSYSSDSLRTKGTFPCIVFWNFAHFIVVNGFTKNKVSVNDPAKGKLMLDRETFDKYFTGVCLFFEPDEGFKPEGKPRSTWKFAFKQICGSGSAYLFILILTMITALIGILELGFNRFFMDRLLNQIDTNHLLFFCNVMAVLCVMKVVAEVVGVVYNNRIEAKMFVIGSASYVWKLLRIPLEFFTQRMPSDLLNRKVSNASIARDIVYTFAPLVFQGVMMIFYLAAMIRCHVGMAAIGLASVAINFLFMGWVNRKYINLSRGSVQQLNAMNSETIRGIDMIDTIKASGNENGSFSIWAGCQAMYTNISVKLQMLSLYHGLIPNLINGLVGVVIVGIGTGLTMRGDFTIGTIMAFSGFLNGFSQPAGKTIKACQDIQKMSLSIDRIEDVLEYPDDEILTQAESCAFAGLPSGEKLKGKIELKDVAFGYDRLTEPIIRDFNLTVEPGQSVALVGGSGSGKSTVSKLLCGLYAPRSGEILLDGRLLTRISRPVFCASIGLVDQDIALFDDTVLNNITLWNDAIPFSEVERAAKDACIHDEIMERTGGYYAMMAQDGRNYSGGQRQRIEIARVLATNPSILIMDEATSALDSKTEAQIARAVRARHITCIIIAHRLSTVRDCDRIVVLNNGEIAEQGTHEELYAREDGLYRKLVQSE